MHFTFFSVFLLLYISSLESLEQEITQTSISKLNFSYTWDNVIFLQDISARDSTQIYCALNCLKHVKCRAFYLENSNCIYAAFSQVSLGFLTERNDITAPIQNVHKR